MALRWCSSDQRELKIVLANNSALDNKRIGGAVLHVTGGLISLSRVGGEST